MSNCNHKRSKVIDMKYPEYIEAECEECGETIRYSGLVMTGMKESLPENSTVIIERTITYSKG